MLESFRRLSKYLASFFKSEWTLSDYPIRVRELPTPPALPPHSHLKLARWNAQIVGWLTPQGLGDTRDEALADLAEAFQRRLASGKPLPRPGTARSDLEFAAVDRLTMVEYLAPRFFSEVLQVDYADCFVSDESSLWDFHSESDNEEYFERIAERYGVNVRDIESSRIVDILERIRLLSPSA
ncbi:MAG: hypothetical protein JNL44_15975 [Gemmatimonadetes bacterium]|nr:hypothetical protein [Gemmatimonadota bacterium]